MKIGQVEFTWRAHRQALVDLWKQDDQAWNLYCYGKRASK